MDADRCGPMCDVVSVGTEQDKPTFSFIVASDAGTGGQEVK